MPWQKAFDVDEVRNRAMGFYWSHGYRGTSMAELLAHLGVNRGSFYDTFGSKRDLFLASLGEYRRTELAPVVREAEGLPPREGIGHVFEAFRAQALAARPRRGCLIVNSALELGVEDAEVAAIVAETLREIESFFRSRIRAGQSEGGISPHIDPRDGARNLTALLFGMRVLEKTGVSPACLGSIVREVDRILT